MRELLRLSPCAGWRSSPWDRREEQMKQIIVQIDMAAPSVAAPRKPQRYTKWVEVLHCVESCKAKSSVPSALARNGRCHWQYWQFVIHGCLIFQYISYCFLFLCSPMFRLFVAEVNRPKVAAQMSQTLGDCRNMQTHGRLDLTRCLFRYVQKLW